MSLLGPFPLSSLFALAVVSGYVLSLVWICLGLYIVRVYLNIYNALMYISISQGSCSLSGSAQALCMCMHTDLPVCAVVGVCASGSSSPCGEACQLNVDPLEGDTKHTHKRGPLLEMPRPRITT
jgi:hypothetical protein